MEKDTTWKLNGDRLARLLKLGMKSAANRQGAEADPPPERALAELLSRKLSLEEEITDSLPAVLGRSCSEMRPWVGRTLGELLASPETSVGAFEALKDYGKTLASSFHTKVGEAAATVIYYAAISGALVFHRRKITRHPYGRLDENLAKLTDRAWVSEALRALFRQAQAICRQRMAEPQGKESV